jgi:hypothetical protein
MTETIWMHDAPGIGYHDMTRCRCDRHCAHCFEDLDMIRELHKKLIAEGRPGAPARPLHPRARYCSPYCKGRAKRERAFDRALAAVTVKEET